MNRLAAYLVFIVVIMVGAAFASVPLYNMFCKVTGFGGTVQKAQNNHERVGKRKIQILFDSNLDKKLPWKFVPKQREINIIPGENALAYYYSENLSDKPLKGMAIYNVTPHKVGRYFNKIECFCFEEFTLAPKQQMWMPVLFFIDPKIEDDEDANDVYTITLSYTFFKYD